MMFDVRLLVAPNLNVRTYAVRIILVNCQSASSSSKMLALFKRMIALAVFLRLCCGFRFRRSRLKTQRSSVASFTSRYTSGWRSTRRRRWTCQRRHPKSPRRYSLLL